MVTESKAILEIKQTDAITTRRKQEKLVQLAMVFNANTPGTVRNSLILKRKYENMKKRSRQAYGAEKKYALGTGGGAAVPTIINNVVGQIRDILGNKLTGKTAKLDDDYDVGVIFIRKPVHA